MNEPSRVFTTSLELAQRSKGYEQNYDKELHRRFVKWKSRNGISLRKLVPMLNRYSYTSIGQYTNFRFEGDLRIFEQDIRKLLDRKEGVRFRSKSRVFCKIPLSEFIWEFLQTCHKKGQMGAFISPSGTSKTETITEYKEKNPWTIVITASPTRRSFSAVLRALASEVGGVSQNMARDDIMRQVIDRLKNSGRLVIFDESHFFAWASFEVIRTIFDATRIGFSFLGTEKLYSQMVGDARYSWDQVLSRITVRRRVSEVSYGDVEGITDMICPGLSKGALKFLYQVAQEPGRLRTMLNLLKNGIEIAEAEGIKVDFKLLKDLKSINDF